MWALNIPFPSCLPCLLLVSLFPALTRGQSVDFIGTTETILAFFGEGSPGKLQQGVSTSIARCCGCGMLRDRLEGTS
jgi:hypothetical protein